MKGVAPARRIADVCIGDFYLLRKSRRPVEIAEYVQSGCWIGRLASGAEVHVTFADLGEKLPSKSSSPIDKQRLAAGDKGDEG